MGVGLGVFLFMKLFVPIVPAKKLSFPRNDAQSLSWACFYFFNIVRSNLFVPVKERSCLRNNAQTYPGVYKSLSRGGGTQHNFVIQGWGCTAIFDNISMYFRNAPKLSFAGWNKYLEEIANSKEPKNKNYSLRLRSSLKLISIGFFSTIKTTNVNDQSSN